jgi:hypothetical protein
MSAIILFLYSKYYPNINILLNLVSSIDFIHTICVDNKRVRDVIMRSSLVSVKKVPCFVVIFPDKSVNQYVGNDMASFMNNLLEKTQKPQRTESGKTSIDQLVPEVPETTIEITEEHDDDIMSESQPPPQKNMQHPPAQNKSGKSDIGSLINFSEGKPQQNTNSVSRSRSELTNRENLKIEKGKGHEGMTSTSLGVDITTSKSKTNTNSRGASSPNIIEDIDEGDDEDTMLFASDSQSGMVKNTGKSKMDIKQLAMEMANGRGEKL